MADYLFPTVVKPSLPAHDLVAIEQMLLAHVFAVEADGDDLYFFAEAGPEDMPDLPIGEVHAALAASDGVASRTADFVRQQLEKHDPDENVLFVDRAIPWEAAFQDIIRRSQSVRHVVVTSAYTCTKMRADGFGGAVTVITADHVLASSTHDMEHQLLDLAEFGELGAAPGHGVHVLLRLAEEVIGPAVDQLFEGDAPPDLARDDVTEADIREACIAVKARLDLSHEEGEAIFNAAGRAIRIAAERKQAAH